MNTNDITTKDYFAMRVLEQIMNTQGTPKNNESCKDFAHLAYVTAEAIMEVRAERQAKTDEL